MKKICPEKLEDNQRFTSGIKKRGGRLNFVVQVCRNKKSNFFRGIRKKLKECPPTFKGGRGFLSGFGGRKKKTLGRRTQKGGNTKKEEKIRSQFSQRDRLCGNPIHRDSREGG